MNFLHKCKCKAGNINKNTFSGIYVHKKRGYFFPFIQLIFRNLSSGGSLLVAAIQEPAHPASHQQPRDQGISHFTG